MNKWYAYKHVDGTVHPKRYFDEGDIVEAIESPFVEAVTRPFLAENREGAMRIGVIRLSGNSFGKTPT